MPTGKKTTKVGSIHHKGSDTRIELNVDRDSRLFWATVGGERIEHAEGKEVERLVLEALDLANNVPWLPVIQVSPFNYGSIGEGETFGFAAKRIHVAKLPTGGWRQSRWESKEKGKLLAWSEPFAWREHDFGAFKPPCIWRGYSGSHTYYLPYTDAVYARLVWLQRQLRLIREEFESMLSTEEGIAMLAELRIPLPAPLLPAPAGNNDGAQ